MRSLSSAPCTAFAASNHADRGLDLVAAFDQIPLQKIVDTMRGLDLFKELSIRQYLSMIVENKVRRILFPPQPEPPPKPSKKERIAADKQAAAAANRRLVEQKIELGRKLVALRDTMPSNQKFSWTVRKQFGLDDPLHVAEMMRVARLYGERPEIFRSISWRALVELASTATSPAHREKFEARILAGERINGAEIIRARGARDMRGREASRIATPTAPETAYKRRSATESSRKASELSRHRERTPARVCLRAG